MTKPVIFYHANCQDGFGAAFAAWMAFRNEAEYIPMSYGSIKSLTDVDLLGDLNREVFILDFSFPREVMDYIIQNAQHTVWLDHHKTAFEMFLPGIVLNETSKFTECDEDRYQIILDNARSGAAIAWDYFVSDDIDNRPLLIEHIDDYDRWQFKNPNTKAFGRALRALEPWSFEQWHNLMLRCCEYSTYESFIEQGEVLLAEHKLRTQNASKHACSCTLNIFFTGLACNAPPDLASDLGYLLAKDCNTFGMTWSVSHDLRVKCSLRSTGDYDVSAIAKTYGGGGHKNAAGFETTFAELMTMLGVEL